MANKLGTGRRRWLWAAALATAAVAVAGCGSSGSGGSGSNGSGKVDLSKYRAAVNAAKAPVKWNGPASTPKPRKDVYAVIVTCTEALEGCRLNALGDQEGVRALGWRNQLVNVTDPSKYGSAITTGLNEGADIIFLVGIPETVVGSQIAAAHAKGVPVVSTTQYNVPGGKKGVDVEVSPDGIKEGKLIADAMIVDQHGSPDVQMFSDPEFGLPVAVLKGAKKELSTCSSCKVESDVGFTAADVQNRLPDLTVSTLRSKPNVNSLLVGYDPPVTFMVPAIKSAGYADKVKLYGQIGTSDALNFVRKGEVMAADISFPIEWAGWAGVDEGIRLLAHQKTVDEHLPTKLITKDNAPPPGQAFDGDNADYKGHYKKLWGVK